MALVPASSHPSGAPSGAAGGDLGGTYPNPTIAQASGNLPFVGATPNINTPNQTGATSSQGLAVRTGSATNGNAGGVTLAPGASSNGTGGSVTLQPGSGDTAGTTIIKDAGGTTRLQVSTNSRVKTFGTLELNAAFDGGGQELAGIGAATAPGSAPELGQLSPFLTILNGALPTQQLVSGAGAQILTTRDAETVTPVTFNSGAATTATCLVALSPDNVTYSALVTETEPVGVAFAGTIRGIRCRVPAGWYLRMTVTNATLGVTTYY